jgi:hypothetical protein
LACGVYDEEVGGTEKSVHKVKNDRLKIISLEPKKTSIFLSVFDGKLRTKKIYDSKKYLQ